MKRVRIIVEGGIQGVGYRYFVSDAAMRYNVNGYVRNLAGGQVEIDAEGEQDNVNQFLFSCKEGPQYARIDTFLVSDAPCYGFDSFRIKF